MPRSASRDLADRYSGNRQYHRRANALERWKWLLTATALLGSLAYVGAGFLSKPGAPAKDYRYTHGPLTSPHAAWDNNCEACHLPSSTKDLTPAGLLHADSRWQKLSCERCHAGPKHYTTQPSDSNACHTCHHDHQGRDHSLIKLSDDHCTKCHANLRAHPGTPGRQTQDQIAHFAEHPNFRILEQEKQGKGPKRGLKFSHALHLSPGIAYPKSPDAKFTIGKLVDLTQQNQTQQLAKLYGDLSKPESLVQMQCQHCHQLDSEINGRNPSDPGLNSQLLDLLSGLPRHSLRPSRSAGADYLAINYDLHCKACHPNFVMEREIKDKQVLGFPLSHRIQPQDIRRAVFANFSGQFLETKELPPALERGERFDPLKKDPEKLKIGLLKETNRVLREQFPQNDDRPNQHGCTKCHDIKGTPTGDDWKNVAIVPTLSPPIWLVNAKFNHATHRGTSCDSCHGEVRTVKTNSRGDVVDREPLHIPAIDSCRVCHSEARVENGQAIGGIGLNCTDCHRYHNGEHPLQGRGATARDSAQPWPNAQDFLQGREGKRQP
ncbi:MAG: cytochrome c3 family protein [Gemmataceae bacterium]